VRWRHQWLNVGHALIEQDVGFHEVADGVWDVYFSTLQIGRFDERPCASSGRSRRTTAVESVEIAINRS